MCKALRYRVFPGEMGIEWQRALMEECIGYSHWEPPPGQALLQVPQCQPLAKVLCGKASLIKTKPCCP